MTYETLHDRLRGSILKALKEELKVKNALALPRIDSVVINVGINRAKMEGKEKQEYVEDCLEKITGQQPIFTRARKAISNFKVREGMIVGAVVTLRGNRMEAFLDRLLSYALPRVRDFRGVTTKLDGHGNYSLGIRDHSIFPEVPPADAKQIFGMQVTIKTTAENDETGRALFKAIGMPFIPSKKAEEQQEAAQQKELEKKKEVEEALEQAKKKEKKDNTSVASKENAPDTGSSKSPSS